MNEQYLIKTKSGSMYPLSVEAGLFSKGKMTITTPKGSAHVMGILDNTEPKNWGDSEIGKTIDTKNLRPGKFVFFFEGNDMGKTSKWGHTSKIEEVYRKVA